VTELEAETVAAPAATTRVTQRGIQITLGLLWLLDGALQLQPFMFGPDFAGQGLAAAADGQPGWVASGVRLAAGLVGAHPAVWNTLFAAVQLAIGAGLLYRPLARAALAASMGWALLVWYFGEGLGGIASGHASLLTGAPGAVLLYGLLAAIAWPPRQEGGWLRHDSSGPPAVWTPIAWAVVWVGGAVLQALPGQNTPGDLAGLLTGNAPMWQMGLNDSIANHVRTFGTEDNWLLLAVLVAIGLLALGGRRQRMIAGWAGALVATVCWMIGQGFGGLFSGQATDPNSGPLLILLSLALLGMVPDSVAVESEPELARSSSWRTPAMSGIVAVAVVGVALLQWGTGGAAPADPPHITVSDVYTPVGSGAAAPVYFTLTNSGGADTLVSAGTEFQTAATAKGVTVCADASCGGGNTVSIPAHGTLKFDAAGPHLLVRGLGTLTMSHQPLQITLTFTTSGVTHVLSPMGSPNNLTESDVMTYGYMGHRDPGMDMGSDGDSGDMSGMDMSGGH
jgi:copper(I)-binding protein